MIIYSYINSYIIKISKWIQSSSVIQFSTISFKLGFSIAAAILSLSLICLLTTNKFVTFYNNIILNDTLSCSVV
jgi:hypothetical protein